MSKYVEAPRQTARRKLAGQITAQNDDLPAVSMIEGGGEKALIQVALTVFRRLILRGIRFKDSFH